MKPTRLLAAAFSLCIVLSACTTSAKKEQNDNTSPQETTAATTETIAETAIAATTEAVTETTAEDMQKKANQAYIDYLLEHSAWFIDGTTQAEKSINKTTSESAVAFCDINQDGVKEMVHVRPEQGRINLTVVTYDNAVKTVYDELLVEYAGAEYRYFVFISEDAKLYSVAAKELSGSVVRFDANGKDITPALLASSQANHLAEAEEAVCEIDGKSVDYKTYRAYWDSIESSVETYLLVCDKRYARPANDISSTYFEALDYLRSNI